MNIRFSALTAVIMVWLAVSAAGQTPTYWVRDYPGGQYDLLYGMEVTADGGSVLCGKTDSFGVGEDDCIVIRLDPDGNIIWQKTYGTQDDECLYSVRRAPDGGFVACGSWKNSAMLMKLDASGNILWQKVLRDEHTKFCAIALTGDSCCVTAGRKSVLKVDSSGSVVWERTFDNDNPNFEIDTVAAAPGNGCLVSGWFNAPYTQGESDIYLARLSSSGDIIWQKCYGGIWNESVQSIAEVPGEGFILAGNTYSFGSGGADGLIMKVDYSGNTIWTRAYGLDYNDAFVSVCVTSDNNILAAGSSSSLNTMGQTDGWVIKLGSDAAVLWNRAVGSDYPDDIFEIKELPGVGFLAAGCFTHSSYPSFSVIKADPEAEVEGGCPYVAAISLSQTGGMLVQQDASVACEPSSSASAQISLTTMDAHCSCGIRCTSTYYGPIVRQVKVLSKPFRLEITGGWFESGAEVLINGVPAPKGTLFKRVNTLVAKKGAALKAMVPYQQVVNVQVSNPDGKVSDNFHFVRD